MRGRTNITQRTGPSVIGQLVTQKQVTGSKIEVGDFVEFTGDTSNWEVLSGPFVYNYSKEFHISDVGSGDNFDSYNGVFYTHSQSSKCKFIIFNKTGIVKITDISDIEFPNSVISRINFDSNTNKIYVLFNSTKKFYEFNLLNNYSVEYVKTIDVPVQSTYGSTINLLCVKDGYLYCYTTVSSPEFIFYILKISLDGETVLNVYSCNLNSNYSATSKNIFITDNYIFFITPTHSSTSSGQHIIFNFTSGNIVEQNANLGYLSYCYAASLVEKDGYFFMVGWSYDISMTSSVSYSETCYAVVFYLDGNMKIKIDDYVRIFNSNSLYNTESYNVTALSVAVKKQSDKYIIVASYSGRNWYGNVYRGDTFYCCLLNFNISDNDLIKVYEKYFSRDRGNPLSPIVVFLIDYVYSYHILFTDLSSSSGIDNYLSRTKILISNNEIIQSESLDLVKKYSNRIDGVAKTEGSAGQTISVYIPES